LRQLLQHGLRLLVGDDGNTGPVVTGTAAVVASVDGVADAGAAGMGATAGAAGCTGWAGMAWFRIGRLRGTWAWLSEPPQKTSASARHQRFRGKIHAVIS